MTRSAFDIMRSITDKMHKRLPVSYVELEQLKKDQQEDIWHLLILAGYTDKPYKMAYEYENVR